MDASDFQHRLVGKLDSKYVSVRLFVMSVTLMASVVRLAGSNM